jgi:uncharacterized protein (TIGR03086 family)
MSESTDRFRRLAAGFTNVVAAVPESAWTNPSPCQGWAARDVVRHLVEWIPGPGFLLGTYGIEIDDLPSVDTDPLGAWVAVRDAVQAGLDDPATAQRVEDCGPLGRLTFEAAVDITCATDVFVHTWDLAQAAGIDAALDDDELRRQLDTIASIPPQVDDAMRSSGHYGPRLDTADDADPITVVMAFYGRRPLGPI